MGARRKILFLTARLPFPLVGGDRVKPHYLLKHLARNNDVTLVSFSQGRHYRTEFVQALEGMGIETHVVRVNPAKAGIAALCNAYRFPLEIGYYYSNEFRSRVNELLAQNNFDIAFAFFMRTAEYLKDYHGRMKKVLIAEDCRTLYQQRSSRDNTKLSQQAVRAFERRMLKRYEPSIVGHFDAVTFVTETDICAMREMNPAANYFLISNGFDDSCFSPPTDFASRRGILFCGKLDVSANEIMAERCLGIFQIVRSRFPEAQLTIAGANPPKLLLRRVGDGIAVVSDPPEMSKLLRECRVFVHPHTGGSGIQNKLIEAMACGAPIVSTPTGIQGIHFEDGVHGFVASEDDQIAERVIELLRNESIATEFGSRAAESAREYHRWENVFAALDELIERLSNDK